MPLHEWTKEDLNRLRPGTLAMGQVAPDRDREYVLKRPDHPEMWVSWQGEHIAGGAMLAMGEVTVLYDPGAQGVAVVGPDEGHEDDAFVMVPVIGTANGNDRPRDYEPENWATDGSADMERESLKGTAAYWRERARKAEAAIEGAKVLVENLSGMPALRREPTVSREVRELRMLLNGGDANRKTARADELVQAWLEDPKRSVFGLAADLLDVLGPEKRP